METCGKCGVTILENNPYVHIQPYTEKQTTLCYDCYITWTLYGRPEWIPQSIHIKEKKNEPKK